MAAAAGTDLFERACEERAAYFESDAFAKKMADRADTGLMQAVPILTALCRAGFLVEHCVPGFVGPDFAWGPDAVGIIKLRAYIAGFIPRWRVDGFFGRLEGSDVFSMTPVEADRSKQVARAVINAGTRSTDSGVRTYVGNIEPFLSRDAFQFLRVSVGLDPDSDENVFVIMFDPELGRHAREALFPNLTEALRASKRPSMPEFSLVDDMKSLIEKEMPGVGFEKLTTTRHPNVLRLVRRGSPPLVAKSLWHDLENPEDPEKGKDAMDASFLVEGTILQSLPKWWGLKYVDAFGGPYNRVIVTEEIPAVPWNSYAGDRDEEIASDLVRQIQWLHAHGMAHGDLERKNILLSESGRPIIIDFEKGSVTATPEQMADDNRKIVEALSLFPVTRNIATIVEQKLSE